MALDFSKLSKLDSLYPLPLTVTTWLDAPRFDPVVVDAPADGVWDSLCALLVDD